jgi:hypothetical protein
MNYKVDPRKTHTGEGDANEAHPSIIYRCYEKIVGRRNDDICVI